MAILNTVSGAAAAYSLRKINADYTGKCIKVRRNSDNAEQEIAFDTNGNLSANSKIEDGTTSFSTWYGSDSVYITKWYDQSGNNKNAIRNTSTLQPRIVIDGAICTNTNGKPEVNFRELGNHSLSVANDSILNFGTGNFSTNSVVTKWEFEFDNITLVKSFIIDK